MKRILEHRINNTVEIAEGFYATFERQKTTTSEKSTCTEVMIIRDNAMLMHFIKNNSPESHKYTVKCIWVEDQYNSEYTFGEMFGEILNSLEKLSSDRINIFINMLFDEDGDAKDGIETIYTDSKNPYEDPTDKLHEAIASTTHNAVNLNVIKEIIDEVSAPKKKYLKLDEVVSQLDKSKEEHRTNSNPNKLHLAVPHSYLNNQMYFVSKYEIDVRKILSVKKDPMSEFSKATTWPEFNAAKIVLYFREHDQTPYSDNIFISSSIDGAINAYCEANGSTIESLYLYSISCNVINEYEGPMTFVLGCPRIDIDDLNNRTIPGEIIARIAKVKITGFIDVAPSHAVYSITNNCGKYLLDAAAVTRHGTKADYGWHEVNTRAYTLIPTPSSRDKLIKAAGNVVYVPYDDYEA